MTDENASQDLDIDHILAQVIKDNPEKVMAWIRGEPGAWGFLAGKSVTAARNHVGRTLSALERRVVWNRTWWWLQKVKAELPNHF